MKKFLSLVLALVMTMSLVTISAGAKEFTDDDTITYDEAINVISTIGVVDGYADGSFRPTDVLTRGAAAKIICNLILGPTTAAELHATTAPYKDVPTTNTFAGYIAYCAKEGIISGYADGTFRPSGTLTGYAFMKMLLGALNYDAEIEGYTGANWSINVAKQALAIGLNKGLEGDFNGVQAVTRQDACLYAFNTLQADLVEYDTTISATINGQIVTIGNSLAKAQKWNSSATRINNIKNDEYIQFAEQYFNKLQKKDDTDVFGRPAFTWVYDKREIGTYVDYTTLIAEYSEKVTGKTLYEEITKAVLDDSKILVYVDGETEKDVLGKAYFTRNQIAKSYDEKVGQTGNGVLTQVFVDTDADEVIIAIINTYLAKAAEDYDEKNDEVDLDVYSIKNLSASSKTPVYVKNTDEKENITVSGDDFDIAEVEEDDLFLVTIADGEIQSIEAPEILAETTITNFKLEKYVTADGSKIDYADTVQYDEEVLDQYDDKNMKEVTYNVILDPYGYMIGIELVEEPDQYVFLTGIDLGSSNLSKKNADANVIFTDGTMDTITVNMTDSEMTTALKDGTGKVIGTTTSKLADLDVTLSGGSKTRAQLNTWCTYTVDKNGVYTLKQVAPTTIAKDKAAGISAVKVAQVAQNVGPTDGELTIDNKNVSLAGGKTADSAYDFTKVYGNDNTIYLTVDEDDLENIEDKTDNKVRIINDVSSVATGIKNVKLTVKDIANDGSYEAPVNEIYTLYKDNGYIIAAVVIGEDDGVSSNYAYVTSDEVEQEAYDSSADEYTWSREVVINGEVVELKEVGDHLKYLKAMNQGEWYEVKYDANGNVRNVTSAGTNGSGIAPIKFSANTYDKFAETVYNLGETIPGTSKNILEDNDTAVLADVTTVNGLSYKDGTLYTTTTQTRGFSVAPTVKVVLVLADEDGDTFDDVDDGYTGYTGLEKALRNLNGDASSFTTGDVQVHAVFENGDATSIILNDKRPAPTSSDDAALPVVTFASYSVTATEGDTVTLAPDTITSYDGRDFGKLSYQWYKNGVKIAGETNKTLTLENVATGSDSYGLVVTNTDTSDKITGKTEVPSARVDVTLTVSAKAPEVMDVFVTVKKADGVTVIGTELIEATKEPGKQYAIIGGTTNPVSIIPDNMAVTTTDVVTPFVAGGYETATVIVDDVYSVTLTKEVQNTSTGSTSQIFSLDNLSADSVINGGSVKFDIVYTGGGSSATGYTVTVNGSDYTFTTGTAETKTVTLTGISANTTISATVKNT